MSEPNYQCEILEERPKKYKTPKIWNKYSYNYVYGIILTITLMYLYYKTKYTFFFYDSESNIKYIITLGLLCILALGIAGVWIKNQKIKVVKGKKLKRNVDSDKKKMLADVILYSYMIFLGIIGLAYQKFGKTPIKPIK
jgi:hypothetical protein